MALRGDDGGGPLGSVFDQASMRETTRTWANLVTVVRTAAAVPLGMAAAVEVSLPLLIAAYLTYWIGDVADGVIARIFDQETRIGAVLDVVADRASSGVCLVALAVIEPALWPALAVYALQFMVLDAALTLSFLRWPILGPNDFHLVDAVIWRWNWSKPAKAANTAGVILAAAVGQAVLALVIATLMLIVKLISTRRLLQLTSPG